jgi:Carboxypeptidase regulatory-like domain
MSACIWQNRKVSMRKLQRMSVAALAVIAVLALTHPVLAQRGRQADSRTLTGRVFNRQDAPVGKAIVYLKNTKSLAIKTYITEQDGSYRFPALATNVDYEVYAEYQGSRSDTKTLSGFDSRTQANITLKLK